MSGHGEAQSEEETKLQLHSEFIYLLNALIDSESPQSIQLSNSMSCNNDSDKQFICGTKNPPPIEHLDISDNFMTEISMSVERKFRKDNGLEPRENISGVASQTIDKDVQYMTAHGKIALLIETSPHLRSLHLRNTGIADSTTKEMHVPLLLKAMDAAKERKSKPESNENRLESLSINCWSIEQEKSEIEIESGRLGLARFSWYDTRMILRLMHFNESITSLDFTQIQGRGILTSEGDKKVTIEMMRNAVKDLLRENSGLASLRIKHSQLDDLGSGIWLYNALKHNPRSSLHKIVKLGFDMKQSITSISAQTPPKSKKSVLRRVFHTKNEFKQFTWSDADSLLLNLLLNNDTSNSQQFIQVHSEKYEHALYFTRGLTKDQFKDRCDKEMTPEQKKKKLPGNYEANVNKQSLWATGYLDETALMIISAIERHNQFVRKELAKRKPGSCKHKINKRYQLYQVDDYNSILQLNPFGAKARNKYYKGDLHNGVVDLSSPEYPTDNNGKDERLKRRVSHTLNAYCIDGLAHLLDPSNGVYVQEININGQPLLDDKKVGDEIDKASPANKLVKKLSKWARFAKFLQASLVSESLDTLHMNDVLSTSDWTVKLVGDESLRYCLSHATKRDKDFPEEPISKIRKRFPYGLKDHELRSNVYRVDVTESQSDDVSESDGKTAKKTAYVRCGAPDYNTFTEEVQNKILIPLSEATLADIYVNAFWFNQGRFSVKTTNMLIKDVKKGDVKKGHDLKMLETHARFMGIFECLYHNRRESATPNKHANPHLLISQSQHLVYDYKVLGEFIKRKKLSFFKEPLHGVHQNRKPTVRFPGPEIAYVAEVAAKRFEEGLGFIDPTARAMDSLLGTSPQSLLFNIPDSPSTPTLFNKSDAELRFNIVRDKIVSDGDLFQKVMAEPKLKEAALHLAFYSPENPTLASQLRNIEFADPLCLVLATNRGIDSTILQELIAEVAAESIAAEWVDSNIEAEWQGNKFTPKNFHTDADAEVATQRKHQQKLETLWNAGEKKLKTRMCDKIILPATDAPSTMQVDSSRWKAAGLQGNPPESTLSRSYEKEKLDALNLVISNMQACHDTVKNNVENGRTKTLLDHHEQMVGVFEKILNQFSTSPCMPQYIGSDRKGPMPVKDQTLNKCVSNSNEDNDILKMKSKTYREKYAPLFNGIVTECSKQLKTANKLQQLQNEVVNNAADFHAKVLKEINKENQNVVGKIRRLKEAQERLEQTEKNNDFKRDISSCTKEQLVIQYGVFQEAEELLDDFVDTLDLFLTILKNISADVRADARPGRGAKFTKERSFQVLSNSKALFESIGIVYTDYQKDFDGYSKTIQQCSDKKSFWKNSIRLPDRKQENRKRLRQVIEKYVVDNLEVVENAYTEALKCESMCDISASLDKLREMIDREIRLLQLMDEASSVEPCIAYFKNLPERVRNELTAIEDGPFKRLKNHFGQLSGLVGKSNDRKETLNREVATKENQARLSSLGHEHDI
jgi:hypothetical protein